MVRDCIEAQDLSIPDAAAHIRINEAVHAAVCACDRPITAALAIRFEQAFSSTADTWHRLQNAHDLAPVREVKRISQPMWSTRTRDRASEL